MKQERKTTSLIKRIFDIIFALIAVVLLFPVFMVVSIMIIISDGFPVFFTQIRPGKNSVPFKLHKFRSMKKARDQKIELSTDDERITKFGNFLRRTSIDELPELFNILEGKMSIVGPRPLLMQYLERYSDEQARRHEVLPGITGWAQLRYSYASSEEDTIRKLQYDLYYVKNHSLVLDINIMLQTLEVVIWGKGAR